ncbi:tyrosine-protein phosphatase 10D-like isoform X2 [Photinus pyralis]|uniref:tyrosine-protein phosphatase 10D-like isoform X2 n=1 Tax=Photinus pyralis TaxID=7054 RepID=UPI001266E838|nr:tyrosine-protein phosphatase 10D-like isoform X2 [Photinus pyralis]
MKCGLLIFMLISTCQCQIGGLSQYRKDSASGSSNCILELRKEDVSVTKENDVVSVTWKNAPNFDHCNITLHLDIFDTTGQLYSANTSFPSHDIIFPFIGCKVYNLSLVATMNVSSVVRVTFPIAFTKEPSPPTCKTAEIGTSFAVLECALNDEESQCDLSELIIDCKTESGQEMRKIVNADLISVRIENMTACTNYTCVAIVKGSDGQLSHPSTSIPIETKEGVPDPPTLHNVSSITNTSFVIKWAAPTNINGVLTRYRITVAPKNARYYIPQNCSFDDRIPQEYEADPDISSLTVADALSYYEYEVFVEAKTFAYGPRSEVKRVLTTGGIPGEPQDVVFDLIDDKRVAIRWRYPCPANAAIDHFHIQLFGDPQADYQVPQTNSTHGTLATNTSSYHFIFINLQPAFNYTIALKSVSVSDNLESATVVGNFQTPEHIPESPTIKTVTKVTARAFTIEWEEPVRKNGKIVGYYLHILNNGPNHLIPTLCAKDTNAYEYFVGPSILSYRFEKGTPNYNYTIAIQAATKAKNGTLSDPYNVVTSDSESEEVRDIKIVFINKQQEYYNGHININFQVPCNTNGHFERITVILIGNRADKETHKVTQSIDSLIPEYNFLINVQAEYHYELTVQVVTTNFITPTVQYFTSPSGVPPLGVYLLQKPTQVTPTLAKVNISKQLFDDIAGDVVYYSVIIGQPPHEEEPKYGFWKGDSTTWPEILAVNAFELTPKFWNPFLNGSKSVYTCVIGEEDQYALHTNVLYALKVRGFTKDGYRDTGSVTFQLTDYNSTALILGSIFGVLGSAMLLVSVCILWRKRRKWAMAKESVKSIPLSPIPISIKGFPQYYSELNGDAEKLKHEYMLLTSKSNEITLSNSVGVMAQNKKRNRYTNVIAYDHSRVILKEVDDSGTDYINASYIQGFTGNVEYIATQGPLEQTVIDFWKMVIQENVSLIVMVAQFVEQNKDKCYKYFPNNHENMELANGFTIRCCTELNFNTYIVRTITIQNEIKQWTITHLQFTDWPDFGCPNGTEIMLEFCQLMREYAEKTSAPIVLHCSAGVGRTGTLIALDILLQAIHDNKDIDIFNTVLNLRRDRKNMVQTEKQYLYIHSCINDAIENPLPVSNGRTNMEPIYENVEDIKKELNEHTITESQF